MDIGVAFDRNLKGELNLGKEGGHHANRIVHCQDVTGLKLSTALIEKAKSLPNLRLVSYHVAIDLIVREGFPSPVASAKSVRELMYSMFKITK